MTLEQTETMWVIMIVPMLLVCLFIIIICKWED